MTSSSYQFDDWECLTTHPRPPAGQAIAPKK